MIDFLKQIFGDEALTFDQLGERIKADASLNIVNAAPRAASPARSCPPYKCFIYRTHRLDY